MIPSRKGPMSFTFLSQNSLSCEPGLSYAIYISPHFASYIRSRNWSSYLTGYGWLKANDGCTNQFARHITGGFCGPCTFSLSLHHVLFILFSVVKCDHFPHHMPSSLSTPYPWPERIHAESAFTQPFWEVRGISIVFLVHMDTARFIACPDWQTVFDDCKNCFAQDPGSCVSLVCVLSRPFPRVRLF